MQHPLLCLLATSTLFAAGLLGPAPDLEAGALANEPASPVGHRIDYVSYKGEKSLLGYGDLIFFENPASAGAETVGWDIRSTSSGVSLAKVLLEPEQEHVEPLEEAVVVHALTEAPIDPKGGCGMDCLPAGTPVRMAFGTTSVEALARGQLLDSQGPGAGCPVNALQERVASSLVEFTASAETLRASLGHAFLTSTGWVEAQDLTVGSALAVRDTAGELTFAPIERVRIVELAEPARVYDVITSKRCELLVGETGFVSRTSALR